MLSLRITKKITFAVPDTRLPLYIQIPCIFLCFLVQKLFLLRGLCFWPNHADFGSAPRVNATSLTRQTAGFRFPILPSP